LLVLPCLRRCAPACAATAPFKGDVTDPRIIRRLEQHPYAWKVWQPFIIQGGKKKDLLVAFGVQEKREKRYG